AAAHVARGGVVGLLKLDRAAGRCGVFLFGEVSRCVVLVRLLVSGGVGGAFDLKTCARGRGGTRGSGCVSGRCCGPCWELRTGDVVRTVVAVGSGIEVSPGS